MVGIVINNKSYKKIAYICNYLGHFSGSGQSGIDVLNAISLLDLKVYVFVPQFMSSISERLQNKKNIVWVRTPKLYFNTSYNSRIKVWIKKITVFVFNFSCIKYRFYKNVSFYKTIMNSFGGYYYFKSLLFHSPGETIIVIRGSLGQISVPDYGIPNKIDKQFCIQAIKNINNRVFVSKNTMNEWTKKYKIDKTTNNYIPNCVYDKKIQALLKKDRSYYKSIFFNPANFNVVFVANIQYVKGQDILFDNYKNLISKIPNIRTYLIGGFKNENGEYTKSVIEKLDSKSYPSIKYLGQKTNVLEYIYAADCLLLPSRGEAMPRVVLEAMALKTPIVASNVDGIPELIKHEINGYLFDIHIPIDMINGLVKVYNTEQEHMVENASKKYWEEFSFNRLVGQYGRLIVK